MRSRRPTNRVLCVLASAVALLGPASARAQNLVENPDFHLDASGWEHGPGTQLLWTNLTDEGECPGSGAALVSSEDTGIGHYAAIRQCVTIGDGDELFARARYLAYGGLTVRFQFYTAFNCATGAVGFAESDWPESPVEWADAALAASPPANANAVELRFTAIDDQPHGLVVDGVVVSRAEPIFLDGFEGHAGGESEPCRWLAP